jgi:hypothetical protein
MPKTPVSDPPVLFTRVSQDDRDLTLMKVIESQLETGRPIAYSGSFVHRAAQFFARGIDRLTGSRRVQACLDL